MRAGRRKERLSALQPGLAPHKSTLKYFTCGDIASSHNTNKYPSYLTFLLFQPSLHFTAFTPYPVSPSTLPASTLPHPPSFTINSTQQPTLTKHISLLHHAPPTRPPRHQHRPNQRSIHIVNTPHPSSFHTQHANPPPPPATPPPTSSPAPPPPPTPPTAPAPP